MNDPNNKLSLSDLTALVIEEAQAHGHRLQRERGVSFYFLGVCDRCGLSALVKEDGRIGGGCIESTCVAGEVKG